MSVAPVLRTPLHDWHQTHGGRMVAFGGWSLPVQYSSIVEEHQAVRRRVGLFDISHMGRLTFTGAGAATWLERVTTNQVARLAEGQVQYSLMANDAGGLIDDVLVSRTPLGYALVCNAANRENVVAQFHAHRGAADVALTDETIETAMIAVQGPSALETLQPLCAAPLARMAYYRVVPSRLLGDVATVVSRTGYTGEDGFEVIVGAGAAGRVWSALLDAGRARDVRPCGLGARDTLRFEAGMPLYGHELSETITPYAAGVGWAVKLNKGEFVGREALRTWKANPRQVRVGLRLANKRIARQGSAVERDGGQVGYVTSGTFAPTLNQSLAMALVEPAAATRGTTLTIDVRGHDEPAEVVPLPLYRRPPSS